MVMAAGVRLRHYYEHTAYVVTAETAFCGGEPGEYNWLRAAVIEEERHRLRIVSQQFGDGHIMLRHVTAKHMMPYIGIRRYGEDINTVTWFDTNSITRRPECWLTALIREYVVGHVGLLHHRSSQSSRHAIAINGHHNTSMVGGRIQGCCLPWRHAIIQRQSHCRCCIRHRCHYGCQPLFCLVVIGYWSS